MANTKLDKDVLYTLKQGADRTGYNLHYFRRKCKARAFANTPLGAHILYTPEQFLALPRKENKKGISSIFDGLEA